MKGWFEWAIFTALLWGFVPLFEKTGLLKAQPYEGVFLRCLGTFLGALVLMAIKPSVLSEVKMLDWKTILSLIFAGILGSVIGQLTNFSALKLGEVSKVSPIAASWPVIAFVVGLVFFGEAFTAQKVIALILIMSGIYCLNYKIF